MKNIYYTVILTISLITSFFPKLIYAQQDRDGSSMERAINIGVKSTAFFYIDTKDTSLWGSAYPPYYLDKGSDVYYTFTLETPMIVLIHTLGSELRGTEIYLYDSSGDCNGKKRLMTKDEYMDYVLETSEDQYTLDIIHDDYFLKDCSVTILDSGTYCVAVHGIKRGNLNWMNGPITTTIIGELMGKYIPMPFPVQPDLPITDLPPDSSPSKDFPSIEPLVVSSDQNYIHTRTMTNDTGTTYLDAIQYFDGLGRPMQTVQKGVTPAQADLVTYQEYDAFGREEKTWLPAVAASNNGAFVPLASFKDKAMTTYNSTAYHPAADSVAYSMPVYEASPLNRVLER
ncbi:MAG: DUF6443 domain-containing protein, partial [Prevotella sp.]|nr:DUF6443 domain-containing protein [Prevotella sp.]